MVVTFQTIQATQALVAFCDQAKQAGWLALDTEFVRTRTFYARLGLLQLQTAAVGSEAPCSYLVDPLEEIDLTPLWRLLADPEVMTVMHAGGEDIEIIDHAYPQAPAQVFDTQIAWAFLEGGEQIGYAPLVEKFCQVTLDKSSSRTDWLKRPLTRKQQLYAASDVYYLVRLFPQLKARIDALPTAEIFYQECAFRTQKRKQPTQPEFAWREIGAYMNLPGPACAVFAKLAAWRHKYARERDMALPFVMKESVIAELALQQPKQLTELNHIEGLSTKLIRQQGAEILALIQAGLEQPESERPPLIPRLDNQGHYKKWFKEAQQKIKEIAQSLKIAPLFIASRKQLNEVFIWYHFIPDSLKQQLVKPDLLQSWRYEYAGQAVLARLEAYAKTGGV